MKSHIAALGAAALGGGGAVAALAAPVGQAEAPGATIAVKERDERVRYHERVAVRGRLSSRASGREVQLQYASAGGDYRTVKRTVSGKGGRYAASHRPRRSGAFRVVADGRSSPASEIAVKARLGGEAERHVRRGSIAFVRGRIRPGDAGRRIYMQVSRLGARDGWHTVDRAKSRRGGRFKSAWRPGNGGRYRVRVRFRGDDRNAGWRQTFDDAMNVYRPARASWYGPGFYGRRTACGRRLGYGTLGVAHRRLPCGERVTLRYRGETVRVPVIDRGPYAHGREFDLTGATKRELDFPSTGRVWATAR